MTTSRVSTPDRREDTRYAVRPLDGITCVRIGYGKVAAIHEQFLRGAGVATLAVLDDEAERRAAAVGDGYRVVGSLNEASELSPTFWDVCASTASHARLIDGIARVNPAARILIEKPVCDFADIQRLRMTLARNSLQIVVNENYFSSEVTERVRRIAFEELGLRPKRLLVEMTKHRLRDALSGRFMDHALGAFGYEGPHLVAIARQFIPSLSEDDVVGASLEDTAVIDEGGPQKFQGQGGGTIRLVSREGIAVELYTSLLGVPRHLVPPYTDETVRLLRSGDDVRYRMVSVQGVDRTGRELSVAGFYEPIVGLLRGEGAVAILSDGRPMRFVGPFADDTMRLHLIRAVRHLCDGAPNPCNVETAIECVNLLNRARRLAGAVLLEYEETG
ncbi:hypothetical protein [Bradyrhizobium lablabi]|uniref:hypothetical protein n=1 Tax=Bradyrhizobium lablabi TaxID=722472 RepID=UPI001BA6F32C|nr:hypothetical protein [Bradyrhizobium lablabi]MBR0695982.1 hypothetical protein [Bradyrhizobium lablabi]